MVRPLIVLLLAFPVWSLQTASPPSVPVAPRPVANIAGPPKAAEIYFGEFEFQQPAFLHAGVGLADIKSEPTAGMHYVVEAHVSHDEAIAWAIFEAFDENGVRIQPIEIARMDGPLGSSRFVGLMTVPARPFRVSLSGESLDGRPFRRVGRQIFRPVKTPPANRIWEGLTREEAAMLQQMIDEQGPVLVAEVRAHLAENFRDRIVMPRMRVSNVTAAPFLSASGRPMGMRIAYDVEFSDDGPYNPELRVEPEYKYEERRGPSRMDVLNSSITPMPREAYPPYAEPLMGDIRTSILQAGAHYTYRAHTLYHFTADLVPDYVIFNLDQTKLCVYNQKFRFNPDWQKSFARDLASETPAAYRVSIGGSAFQGKVENFYGAGTLYQSAVADGAQDCGEQPTRRF